MRLVGQLDSPDQRRLSPTLPNRSNSPIGVRSDVTNTISLHTVQHTRASALAAPFRARLSPAGAAPSVRSGRGGERGARPCKLTYVGFFSSTDARERATRVARISSWGFSGGWGVGERTEESELRATTNWLAVPRRLRPGLSSSAWPKLARGSGSPKRWDRHRDTTQAGIRPRAY